MKKPRFFVGTMYCGEGDFDNCCASIQRQQDVEIEHFIVKNLPEKEAHDSLFSAWNKQKNGFDYFVKIDADTELAHPFILISAVKMFQANERITSIQAPLEDFFTSTLINGLNFFRPCVVFNTAPELYCDRVDSNHDIQIQSTQVIGELRPAGFHCYAANKRQAFHFGLHRSLKNQHKILQQVQKSYEQHQDVPNNILRKYALLGAEAAKHCQSGYNYNDETFEALFSNIEKLTETVR